MNGSVWFWLWNSVQAYRLRLILILASAVVVGVAGAAFPFLFQRVTDGLVSGVFNQSDVVLMIVAITISALPLTFLCRQYLSIRYRYDLRGSLLEHLLHMDMSFHDNRGSTTLTTQVSKGISAADNLVSMLCNGQIIIQIPIAIFAGFYIANHSLLAMFLLLGYIVIFAFVGQLLGKRISAAEEKYEEIDTEITYRQREAIHHIGAVKIHHAEKKEVDHYKSNSLNTITLRDRLALLYAGFNFFSGVGSGFANLVVIIIFGPMVISGKLTIGTFFALSMYASRFLQPATFIGDLYAEIKRESAKLQPLVEILQAKPEVVEAAKPKQLTPLKQGIEIKNLHFTYPGATSLVLKDISLFIPAGKKIAFVGSTGSGKTTLVKLLSRLYDPDQGDILFDGVNLRALSYETLYAELAYLSQEVPIFTGTIEQNVAFGLSEYTESALLQALQRSSCDFIEQAGMQGLQTKVGEVGKKLSGGQKQRIALSRIFIRNPSIIILDEATSALDNVTEAKVQDALDALSNEIDHRTIIIVAHRLTTVQNADQIVVIDQGEVSDCGTHAELLVRSQIYQDLNKTFAD